MKNKGFTFIETIIAIGIVSIIIFTVGILFSSNVRFRIALQDRIILATEAKNTMHHIARKLRFADPATISIVSNPNLVILHATIIGGHIKDNPMHDDEVVDDRTIRYRWTDHDIPPVQFANSIALSYGPPFNVWRTIGENIVYFSLQQGGPDNRDLTIELTSQAGGKVFPLKSKIKILGNL